MTTRLLSNRLVVRVCSSRLPDCEPMAVASWNCINGNSVVLCQRCLDAWFDNADDDPFLKPESWGWLPGGWLR